jgi:hypothetical protein
MKFRSRFNTIRRLAGSPAASRWLLRDCLGRSNLAGEDARHLAATMEWLCRAHDVTGCGGVSSGWSLREGWLHPYPETTGYIIGTFLNMAAVAGNDVFLERAVRMGAWELSIQMPSGAIKGRAGTGEHPLVFDTGQVVQGLVALYRRTKEDRWLKGALKAAEWIISLQEPDGSWLRGSHKGIRHAYYTYVAWPLCEIYDVTRDTRFLDAARKHIQWVLSLRDDTEWIPKMAFAENADPLTHTVAYTYEGLLECSRFLPRVESDEVLENVRRAIFKLMESHSAAVAAGHTLGRALPAFVHSSWQFKGDFSCLVGNAQFASIWLKLYLQIRDERLFRAAVEQIDEVKRKQDLQTRDADIRGAVAGSAPLWGGYSSLSFPNWAAKFFADALMLKQKIETQPQP